MNLTTFRKLYKLNSSNLLTFTNPKVIKSDSVAPTAVLHMLPTATACPASGSCRSICLNMAGNPAYLKGKLACRARRDKAFKENSQAFLNLLVVEILRFYSKNKEHKQLGTRLNGTSDYKWESIELNITSETVKEVKSKFNISIYQGKINILEAILTAIDDTTGKAIGSILRFYDYTKRIDRDFKKCLELNYHLTLSHGSRFDTFKKAIELGLNYAAAFTTKLPKIATYKGHRLGVIDGDVTDWRPDDKANKTHIVGLKMKRTPNQTEGQRKAFCIA